jgi:hypothetical protein
MSFTSIGSFNSGLWKGGATNSISPFADPNKSVILASAIDYSSTFGQSLTFKPISPSVDNAALSADGKYIAMNYKNNNPDPYKNGLLISSDYGNSFSGVSSFSVPLSGPVMSKDGKYIVCWQINGPNVYISKDFGASFSIPSILDTSGVFWSCQMSDGGRYMFLRNLIRNTPFFNSKIYRTKDYGATFTPVITTTNILENGGPGLVECFISNDGKIQIYHSLPNKSYISRDYGETFNIWFDASNASTLTNAFTTTPFSYISPSVVVPFPSSTVYTVTYTVNGNSYPYSSVIKFDATGKYMQATFVVNINGGYGANIVSYNYISSNYGVSWSQTSSDTKIGYGKISYDGKYRIYNTQTMDFTSRPYKTYFSNDYGSSWSNINNRGIYYWRINTSYNNKCMAYIDASNLLNYTTDSGTTWTIGNTSMSSTTYNILSDNARVFVIPHGPAGLGGNVWIQSL